MTGQEFRFGTFCLRPAQRELLRDGRSQRIEKIPFDLLVLLVQRAGELVPRGDLIKMLWGPGTFQDMDASLNTAVRKLRAALRDPSDSPRLVQTVVGQGYRFIGQVEAQERQAKTATATREIIPLAGAPGDDRQNRRPWLAVVLVSVGIVAVWLGTQAWLRSAPHDAMVAVLPFDDLAGDGKQSYFSQGMTEEMITQLGRSASAGVSVIAAPSVRQYLGKNPAPQQLINDLGATYVVTGSVRREGPTMRITARLVRMRDQIQIWAEAFEGNTNEILALQQNVALSVARAVAAQLGRDPRGRRNRPGPINPEAYELYLRGRFYWNQRSETSLKLAVDYFRQTLARADYAPAHAAIADCFAALVYGCYMAPAEGFAQARAALERARAIDGGSPEVLASEGYLSMYFDWDFDAAKRKFEAAIAANPSYAPAYDWMGVLLTATEKPDSARAALEQAIRLDPGSLPVATDLGFHLHYSGRNRQAEDTLRRVLARDPNFGLAHFWMGRVRNAEGDCKGALRELASVPASLRQWQPLIAARAYVAGACGDRDDAQADLTRFEEIAKERFVTSYGMALIYAGLGNKDEVLTWLRKAVEERSHWMVWIRLDPRFNSFRRDPGFRELVAKVFQ
jgi:TolB-like protein/DNA-binding winged helix-turn-helix (wHTH) protein